VNADTALDVPAPGLLANDGGPNPSSLQAAVIANPTHGTLSLQRNGAFTYTPTPFFSGTDSFTYQTSDSINLPATATVTISVNGPPILTSDAFTVAEGAVLNVPAP